MPRSNRYILPGRLYHVTHRCHDREFLLAEACDRTEYQHRLSAALKRFEVSLLGYIITSNHTHEILTSQDPKQISRMMQSLEGKFGQWYNARMGRGGAFWEDRFHATMIEEGSHLLNCMVYIDLNMVRAGVVNHPEQWEWCGYHELVGNRNDSGMIDHDLLRRLLGPLADEFLSTYRSEIDRAIDERRLARESCWTESVAVGSRDYVRQIEELIRKRKKRIRSEEVSEGRWCVKEDSPGYGNAALEQTDDLVRE